MGGRNHASFCKEPARKSFSKDDPANSLIWEQYAVIWFEMSSDSIRLGTSTCSKTIRIQGGGGLELLETMSESKKAERKGKTIIPIEDIC